MANHGISPLIATVLVIGFAIALSGIMMTWGTSFVKDIQERSEKSSLKDIACTKDVGLNIKSATVLGNKIKLVIENIGQMNMDKLNILLVGSDGGDNIKTGSGISAGGIQSFSVALDPNKIGTFKQVEAMPYITFEGEQIACKDAVDKEENLGMDTDGLVAYYKLDGDAKDSAGNNNGVINGNPANVNGVFGNALDFDGIDDYILAPSHPGLRPLKGFTVEAWVKVNNFADIRTIFMHDGNGGGNDGYGLRVDSSRAATFFALNGNGWSAQSIYSSETLTAGIWYHLVGIYDNNYNLRIYINGVEDSNSPKATLGDVTYEMPTNVNIGRRGGSGSPNTLFMKGTIDEVKIYNKAKTY